MSGASKGDENIRMYYSWLHGKTILDKIMCVQGGMAVDRKTVLKYEHSEYIKAKHNIICNLQEKKTQNTFVSCK